jgi:hypothetical protein
MFLGFCELHDGFWPEQVPEIMNVGRELRKKADRRVQWNFKDEEQSWNNLQPAIAILQKACPEIAGWVNDRHSKGKIVWVRNSPLYYARYDFFQKTLYLHDALMGRSDGEKAVTLAHEFRHSRQKTTKLIKRVILEVMTFGNQEEVVERDAYDFERQVYLAIFAN